MFAIFLPLIVVITTFIIIEREDILHLHYHICLFLFIRCSCTFFFFSPFNLLTQDFLEFLKFSSIVINDCFFCLFWSFFFLTIITECLLNTSWISKDLLLIRKSEIALDKLKQARKTLLKKYNRGKNIELWNWKNLSLRK